MLAVKHDGSLWIWGWDHHGGDRALDHELRVENNQPPTVLPPTRIGQANDWSSVSAAGSSMYALKSDGSLWSWPEIREPASEQDDRQNAKPTAAFPEPRRKGEETYQQIAAGGFHDIAIKSDGTLMGWGDNSEGALGEGPRGRSVVVQMTNHRWRSVVTSWCRSAGIQPDHSLWTWGHCGWGEALPAHAQVPTRLDQSNDWDEVALAGQELLALKADGSLWTMSNNRAGGSEKPTPTLQRMGQDSDWSQISARGDVLLALKRDGSLWGWGKYFYEIIDDVNVKYRESPARIGTSTWRTAYAGQDYIVAESQDGTTWVWGNNKWGQLGDKRVLATLVPTPMQPGTHWRFVGATLTGPVGVRDDNSVWEFGHTLRDCGIAKADWKGFALQGGSNLFGIRADGSLWEITCHKGEVYQLPNQPFMENPTQRRWAQLSGTQFGLLALDDKSTLWEFHGQWSDRQKHHAWSPHGQVGSPGTWAEPFAMAREGMVLATKKDGTLWLLDGGAEEILETGEKSSWRSIAAGESDIVGLDSKGHLWRVSEEGVAPIGQRSEWQQVSVGQRHALAVRKDGTLWSWGEGQAGELGTVWAGSQPSPVRVGADKDWTLAVAGNRYSVALKKDGSLWGWGSNLDAELNIGAPLRRELPAKLETP